MTVDGSFPLGAGLCAALIAGGADPIYATLMAIIAGALAGIATGLIHIFCRIQGLLASILTMTALYSINLRLMGMPNIALLDQNTIFSHLSVLATMLIIVIAVVLMLARFLYSQFGLGLRASGVNPVVSAAYGVNVSKMSVITLALSNALVSFAGALFAQSQGFADISMGTGTIIIGLASVIIGEAIIRKNNLILILASCIIGAIIYRAIVAVALNSHSLGLQASDLNLITAILVIGIMMLPKYRHPKFSSAAKAAGGADATP